MAFNWTKNINIISISGSEWKKADPSLHPSLEKYAGPDLKNLNPDLKNSFYSIKIV